MIEIVFVHLGPVIPVHLAANIKRLQRIWPIIRITLILDHILESPSGVNVYIYERNLETQKLFSKSREKDDFWTKSLERLVALAEYVLSQDSQNVILHVESDVLLLPNFPFTEISKIQHLTWNRYNDKKDVGALVLIPNRQLAAVFKEALVKTARDCPGVTDMTLLSILSNDHGIAKTFSSHLIPKNKSYFGVQQSENPAVVSEFKLKGVFDPAQIGMWLAGLDPRNNFGITKYRDNSFIDNGDSEIDPSGIRFTFNRNKNLFGDMGNETEVPIWSLHIHSKNLKLFEEEWADELEFLISKNKKKFRYHWNIRMTFTLLIENYHHKTLIQYLTHLPGIRKSKLWLMKCYNQRNK